MLPYILFFISGSSALIYEVIWARRLALVFGSTVHSVSTVLAAVMAGLALGSLLGGRLARRRLRPLRTYGLLELGVAASAAAVPAVLRGLQAWAEGGGLLPVPARFLVSFAVLLLPTALMGATFPVLARHVARGEPGRDIGRLYAANLLGACVGVAASSFVAIAFLGLSGTGALAVALNVCAGLAAIAADPGQRVAALGPRPTPAAVRADASWAYALCFAAGLTGMAYEVVWTRLLIPTSNNSTYGFASILLVFLAGSGLGSLLTARAKPQGRRGLAWLVILSGVLGFLGYSVFELAELLMIRYGNFDGSGVRPLLFLPLVESCAVLLPLALAQGAAFPAAVRLLAPRAEDAGPAVARLYFCNTLGAIAGSLAAGFWWVPAMNVQNALLLLCALAAAAGTAGAASAERGGRRWAVCGGGALFLLLVWHRHLGANLPLKLLLDWGSRTPQGEREVIAYKEDLEASVAVERRGGTRMLLINGVGVTGYTNATKMMAHVPLAVHPSPERVLVICFGMGATFRSALSHGVRVDVVDIVPAVLEAFPRFYPDAAAALANPRGRRLVNDGRNHLLAEREGYDVIIADPSPPLYAAGTVNLYSKDFFELALRRLKPGGLLTVWVPAYPVTEFDMVLKSFRAACPYTQFWRRPGEPDGLIMIGSRSPIPHDPARIRARLRRPEVRKDMLEYNPEFKNEDAFFSYRFEPPPGYFAFLDGVPEVTDDFPRIEHPYFRSLQPGYFRGPEILRPTSAR
ncbi:MAG TPA: fused MFS/spermidine synthase [Elusimicrobiota bacterium]|nr:fused MFS/spermidine synthase [Elusimicrobiota bacterium]